MKLCIPVSEYCGITSPIHEHFGSAPCFVVVDTETMAVERLASADRSHVHGACTPTKTLAGQKIDAVLVGGIGLRALRGLQQAGIMVCRAPAGTVTEAVQLFAAGELEALDPAAACTAHGQMSGHGCGHGKGNS